MALETAQYLHQLDAANPSGPDRLAQGDDHLRLIKQVLKNTFPNINGAVNATDETLNNLSALMVPVGVMSLWYGVAANVPTGYAICDGRTVNRLDGTGTITTPDMRGRVPQGAADDSKVGTKFGQDSKTVTTEVAGAHNHTGKTVAGEGGHDHTIAVQGTALSISQIPGHTHTMSGNPGTGGGSTVQTTGGSGQTVTTSSTGGGEAHTHTATITGAGAHVHNVQNDAVAAHAHQATVDVVQASIAFHYIMRV